MMTPEKLRAALEEALGRGKVYIHLDPQVDGVSLPSHLMDRESVPLVIAWQAPGIDLALGAERIEATLRFGGTPFRCLVPWEALLAIVADHVPEPKTAPDFTVLEGHSDGRSTPPRPRPALKLIKDS